MEKLAADLLLESKFVELSILPTSPVYFLCVKLGENTSRSLLQSYFLLYFEDSLEREEQNSQTGSRPCQVRFCPRLYSKASKDFAV